jgi:hypothetical protein|tara:strand:- start:181 stop:882 length:702 start_codon:yes stop_codon:yes gene_type:complete
MLELITEVQQVPGRNKAKPSDKDLSIFERIHARTMASIAKSIYEAQFRFQPKDLDDSAFTVVEITDSDGNIMPRAAPEVKDIVYVTAKTSACWTVHKSNLDAPGKNELVWVGIPCGKKFMPWIPATDKDGNATGGAPVSRALIKCDMVVAQLIAWSDVMKNLDKDSKEGKQFHAQAIVITEPPRQKGPLGVKDAVYDVGVDKWIDTPEAAERKAKVAAEKKDILLRWEKRFIT